MALVYFWTGILGALPNLKVYCCSDVMTTHLNKNDTSLWLHNKLGNVNDLWSGGSICSQLNGDVLKNIRDCFPDLQSLVKLKLLCSFLHLPRKNVELVSESFQFSCC